MTAEEQWSAVCGYEGYYEVSDLGRVRRIKSGTATWAGRVLSPTNVTGGYSGVNLCREGEMKTHRIHVLVVRAFVGKTPEGLEINHKDGNKKNNALVNLEFATPKQNIDHAINLGLLNNKGSGNPSAKLNESDVSMIRFLASHGGIQRRLAEIYGVTDTTISSIVKRKTWKHLA